jgi:hypothetical protein
MRPQQVDERVNGYRSAAEQPQGGEHGSLLARTEVDGHTADRDLCRAEKSDLHGDTLSIPNGPDAGFRTIRGPAPR